MSMMVSQIYMSQYRLTKKIIILLRLKHVSGEYTDVQSRLLYY